MSKDAEDRIEKAKSRMTESRSDHENIEKNSNKNELKTSTSVDQLNSLKDNLDDSLSFRPIIKLSSKMNASKESESEEASSTRTHIKLVEGAHPSVVSNAKELDNENIKRLDVFKNRNTHGHSSDSTVQSLLYSQSNEEHKRIKDEIELEKKVSINKIHKNLT